MPRLRHLLDRQGWPVTRDGCRCDEGSQCYDAECQMRGDLEARNFGAMFRAGLLDPPADVAAQEARRRADDLRMAGRGHLVADYDL